MKWRWGAWRVAKRNTPAAPDHIREVRVLRPSTILQVGPGASARRSPVGAGEVSHDAARMLPGRRLPRAFSLAILLLIASLTGGCVEILSLVAGVIGGGAGVYQRYEDRATQKDQNVKIEALTEEIRANRLRAPADYICVNGVAVVNGQPVPGVYCQGNQPK